MQPVIDRLAHQGYSWVPSGRLLIKQQRVSIEIMREVRFGRARFALFVGSQNIIL